MVFKLVFFEHSVISRKLCRNWSAEVVPLVNMALFVTVIETLNYPLLNEGKGDTGVGVFQRW